MYDTAYRNSASETRRTVYDDRAHAGKIGKNAGKAYYRSLPAGGVLVAVAPEGRSPTYTRFVKLATKYGR
jgi:hypothetical protein